MKGLTVLDYLLLLFRDLLAPLPKTEASIPKLTKGVHDELIFFKTKCMDREVSSKSK